MITYFEKFLNEDLNQDEPDFRIGDRVVVNTVLESVDENGNTYHVDIDNQTGVISNIEMRTFYGIIFDNYFSPILGDLDGRHKINRCKWMSVKKLNKIKKIGKNTLKFTENFKSVFQYVEYLDVPVMIDNINYIDITSKPDTISYLTDDRIERLEIWDDRDYDTRRKIYNTSLRQEMKIGKFIQTVNPYTNKNSLDKKIDIYKSAYKNIISKEYKFKVVSGEEIRYWYDERQYYGGFGSLNKSCMKKCLDRLNIYCENPDKVSLLIMLSDDNKLLGRSLLWNVDKPKCIYMDRVYVVFQEDKMTFYDYADENKWKSFNTLNEKLIVFFKKDYGDSWRNPYMDTFKFFCIDGEYGKNYLTTTCIGCYDYYSYDEP